MTVPETRRRSKVEREWKTKEKEAASKGQLVERNERGWIERRREEYCAVSIMTCGYCGEEGTAEGENFVRMECVHDMWCERCRPKKEWLDREVTTGRKSKIKCTACRKKWVAAKCHDSDSNPKLSSAFIGLLDNLRDYNTPKSIYSPGQVTILHK